MITSKTIKVHGYTLHFLECGNGIPVVLLQGFPVSADYWRPTLERLGRSGYRAIAVDILGFGRSEKPTTAPYSLRFFARLFDGLLAALGIAQAVFVGHSFGGKLALATAVLYPKRVSQLVLMDSDGFTPIPLFIRIPGPLLLLGELLLWLASNPLLIRAQMQLGFYDPAPHVTTDLIELGRAVLRVPENRRVLMLMSRNYRDNDLSHTGLRARLDELRCPTLILWGEVDRVFPPTLGQVACREIPTARLVVIPRCGHFPHIEAPRVFHGLLMGFLAGSTKKQR
jgi:pimeloyl-ACP methyl ester carboxylesterase